MTKIFRYTTLLMLMATSLIYTQTSVAAPPVAGTSTQQSVQSLNHPVPGGIAVIGLGAAADAPQVRFQSKPVLVLPGKQGEWLAIVGIALTVAPGTHAVQVRRDASQNASVRNIDFTVQEKKYKEQRLTIKNTRQVNPEPEDLKRINIELAAQNEEIGRAHV